MMVIRESRQNPPQADPSHFSKKNRISLDRRKERWIVAPKIVEVAPNRRN